MRRSDYEQRIGELGPPELRMILNAICRVALEDPEYDDEGDLRTDGEAVAEAVIAILAEWGIRDDGGDA